VSRRTVRLMRMVLATDRDPAEDPDYLGMFSGPFRVEDLDSIVDVDWSVPGEVQVTVAVPYTSGTASHTSG
jgi:hypothetical protein